MKNITFRVSFKSLLATLTILHVFIPAFTKAASLPDSEIQALTGNYVHWSTDSPVVGGPACSGSGTGSSSGPGKVFVLGDSIGTQFTPSLATALNSSGSTGWTVEADVKFGRKVSGGTELPDGITAAAAAGTMAANAKYIIVELGTNGTFSAAQAATLISTLRGHSPNAKIFWIDTAVSGRDSYIPVILGVNQMIYGQAQANSYSVISWYKQVFGADKDPTNISSPLAISNLIVQANQFVHLTDAGIASYNSMIVNALAKGGSAGGCSCTLPGIDNAEKIWNFFIGKGLTPVQTAGIMGNLWEESGLNPRNVQGTTTPDSDTMKIDGLTGYGIAQWTFITRQQALHDFAVSRSTIDGDLQTQLEFMWIEMAGYLQRYRTFTSVDVAARDFHITYEISDDGPLGIQQRVDAAKRFLAELGSLAATGGSC